MPGTHQHAAAEGVALAHSIYGEPVSGTYGVNSGGDIQPAGLFSTAPYKPPKRRRKDNPDIVLCAMDGCKAFPTKKTGYCVGHSAKLGMADWQVGPQAKEPTDGDAG